MGNTEVNGYQRFTVPTFFMISSFMFCRGNKVMYMFVNYERIFGWITTLISLLSCFNSIYAMSFSVLFSSLPFYFPISTSFLSTSAVYLLLLFLMCLATWKDSQKVSLQPDCSGQQTSAPCPRALAHAHTQTKNTFIHNKYQQSVRQAYFLEQHAHTRANIEAAIQILSLAYAHTAPIQEHGKEAVLALWHAAARADGPHWITSRLPFLREWHAEGLGIFSHPPA